ncbi:Arp2/3 complex-activating protein rickA, putative [Entamoeba dispar SAW760]|uniref:Arp2/3 complex-activating protein rickA, putative n=1 Tax=Entamoeba dispar (strain ATCC PRA-260 / SAW760) TaxID=370354 RepID=B0EDS3_ENTDS|nr:Arp2/3 complex-activating protein rickA, putative [Entamoeba dispar SAW760]EDR27336.1 Arp2/3 complex-activating protein rickA, putative [Entamoeba dispar SAW760]|eukprot:EDR27336.1 Arp2/3 complex-activating protein rickA, putative [Entamoeba dispar SAW760]
MTQNQNNPPVNSTQEDFTIKSSSEIKEMDELTSTMLTHLSTILPTYKQLIESCEAYSKAQTTLASCAIGIANQLKGMSVTMDGCTLINTALQSVAGMLETQANTLTQSNKIFVDNTIRIYRGEVSEMPKKIKDTKENVKNDRKKNEDTKEKATKRAKNLKKGDNLKALMESINEAEKTVQKGIVKGLTETTNLMCEMYCQLITGMFVFLEDEQNSSSLNAMFLEKNTPKIKKLSKTQNVWPRRVKDLIMNKKQILINTKWMSDDLKQILKDAGVKRRDLADPDTVQMLFGIITAQVEAGNIPPEILGELQRKDNTPEVHEISLGSSDAVVPPPLPPSSRGLGARPAQSAPQRPSGSAPRPALPRRKDSGAGAPPPPPPPRGGASPRGAPPPPPPPLAMETQGDLPPPPPPRGSHGAPAAPPAPAAPSLLDQIQKGAQLKKVDTNAPRPSMANLNKTQKVDLTSLLASAMQKRREDIADDDDDGDDFEDDSDEWDD